MNRRLKRRMTPTLLLLGLPLLTASFLALSSLGSACADDETPPAGSGGTPGAEAPVAPPPPPPALPDEFPEPAGDAASNGGEGLLDSEEMPPEAPAPQATPAQANQTVFDESVRTFGPMTSKAEYRKLSQLIQHLAEKSAARARKTPAFMMEQWGEDAPTDTRLTIRIEVRIRDVVSADETPMVPERPADSGVIQPRSVSKATVSEISAKLVREAHTLALKDVAPEFGALRKAGFGGMIEVRSSLMVSMSGTPFDPVTAVAGAKEAGEIPVLSDDDKLDAKAQNLMWFARKARDAKDFPRMKNILREILALPVNKSTDPARRLLNAYSVPGY